jgi:hypothetical protein
LFCSNIIENDTEAYRCLPIPFAEGQVSHTQHKHTHTHAQYTHAQYTHNTHPPTHTHTHTHTQVSSSGMVWDTPVQNISKDFVFSSSFVCFFFINLCDKYPLQRECIMLAATASDGRLWGVGKRLYVQGEAQRLGGAPRGPPSLPFPDCSPARCKPIEGNHEVGVDLDKGDAQPLGRARSPERGEGRRQRERREMIPAQHRGPPSRPLSGDRTEVLPVPSGCPPARMGAPRPLLVPGRLSKRILRSRQEDSEVASGVVRAVRGSHAYMDPGCRGRSGCRGRHQK